MLTKLFRSQDLKRRIRAALVRLGWYEPPKFLIVGAQKAGTTALAHYLAGHPELAGYGDKEANFFNPETMLNWQSHPHHDILAKAAQAGPEPQDDRELLDWYHSLFPARRPGRSRVAFEATPEYMFIEDVPKRIRAYNPAMKLIVLLRDPVERAFSAWNMHRSFAEPPYAELHEKRGFEEAVRSELAELGLPNGTGSSYVRRGLYADQLQRLYEQFPREQIHIVESRALKLERDRTLKDVCEFLGVAPGPIPDDQPPVNEGTYTVEMPEETRRLLTEFYGPHNEALFKLLGRRFDWAA